MAKLMLKTSSSPVEKDLPYIEWVVQVVLLDPSLNIMIAKTKDAIFIVGGA